MKKALITGITGQDGSYLAEFLLSKGYEVHGIKRRASSFNTERIDHIYQDIHSHEKNFFLHYGDLTDATNIIRVLKEVDPDEIYNLGAQSHVAVSFETPEYTADVDAGTLRILEGIRLLEKRIKLDFITSSSDYTEKFKKHLKLNELLYPRSPYAVAKMFAFWIVVNYRESYGMYACNGILFNHESPRRGETFVTRKITRGLANIFCGLEKCLYMGNLNALRDWGHAKDYVKMQWLMLQQKSPEDYVISSGEQHSVREFIQWSCEELGIEIGFKGEGENEEGYVKKVSSEISTPLKSGDTIIKVDPRYFRPAEVNSLLGDSSKAKKDLGWKPEITARQMCSDMVAKDLEKAKKDAFLLSNGYEKES